MDFNHATVISSIERSIRWFKSEILGTRDHPLQATLLEDGRIMLGEEGKCWAYLTSDPGDLCQVELDCHQAAGFELPVHSHPANEEVTIEDGELVVELVNGGRQIAEIAASIGSTISVDAWKNHTAAALHDCRYTLVYSCPPGFSGPAVWISLDGVLLGE